MRRTALIKCILSFCALAIAGCTSSEPADSASPGEGRERVTLMLNWYPEAEHGGFFAAKVHGIFEEYGLDVEIRPGGPTAPVAQELVAGRVQFAVGNADDVLVFRQQDVSVVALLAPIQNTPRCILAHADSPVQNLSQLKGMKLQAGGGRPFLTFMEAQGLLDGVQIVPYSGVPNFVADPKSCMQAYSFSEPLLARQAGVEVRIMMVSEIGYNPYASCLMATEDYIEKRPDIVRRMVAACRKGWQRYLDSPAETNAAILKANPEGMSQAALEFGVEQLRPLCITDDVALEDVEAMDAQRWQTLVEQLANLKLIDRSKFDTPKVFNADFLQTSGN